VGSYCDAHMWGGIEVVLHVLVELADGRQVARSCSLVCRQWAGLSREPALWKALVHRFLGAAPTLPQVSSIFCFFFIFLFLGFAHSPFSCAWVPRPRPAVVGRKRTSASPGG
jgi:hypothetical protein